MAMMLMNIDAAILDLEYAVWDLQTKEAARRICASGTVRTASAVLSSDALAAFGEFLWEPGTKLAFFGLMKKLKQLYDAFKKAPNLLDSIQQMIGDLTPSAIKDWARKGKQALKNIGKRIMHSFPLAAFFCPKRKAPGLTDMVARMIKKAPWLEKQLKRVKTNIVDPLDKLLDKHIPNLKRPLIAAIFIFIWLNVVEISWDGDFLWRGFTGALSLGELLVSLPESGLGFVAAAMGLGIYTIPLVIIARIVWLVANHYLEWVPGKGFKIRWDNLDVEDEKPEFVPIV